MSDTIQTASEMRTARVCSNDPTEKLHSYPENDDDDEWESLDAISTPSTPPPVPAATATATLEKPKESLLALRRSSPASLPTTDLSNSESLIRHRHNHTNSSTGAVVGVAVSNTNGSGSTTATAGTTPATATATATTPTTGYALAGGCRTQTLALTVSSKNSSRTFANNNTANEPRRTHRQPQQYSYRNNTINNCLPPLHHHPHHSVAILHFVHYFCAELWRQADWMRRLAGLFFLAGAVAQGLESAAWSLLYPEQVLWTGTIALGTGSFLYFHYKPRVDLLFRSLAECRTREEALDGLLWETSLDATLLLRGSAALAFFILPTLLELRTFQFLTTIVGGSSTPVSWLVILVLSGWYAYDLKCGRGNVRTHPEPPAAAARLFPLPYGYTKMGLYFLYGSALYLTLSSWHGVEKRHIPSLAARFLLSTAVLLYQTAATTSTSSSTAELTGRATQAALRHALERVGTSAPTQPDELLQLTMLRWLVDFWASAPTTTTTPTNPTTTPCGPSGSAPTTPNDLTTASVRRRPSKGSQQHKFMSQHPDLDWVDLWGILQTTTDQMVSEVTTIHHQHQPSMDAFGATIDAMLQPERVNLQAASLSDMRAPSLPSVASMPESVAQHITPRAESKTKPIQSSSGNNNNNQPFRESIHSLQAMLSTMNLDESAKPAVLAYRLAVDAIPTSRNASIALGICRRAPASILLVAYILLGLLGFFGRPITVVVLLFPFVFLECVRIHLWLVACHRAAEVSGSHETFVNVLLTSVDPMTFLLMNEAYTEIAQLPTLLTVWKNVIASADALETSLTTARCVQTTVVAADFAANIFSLASFGLEVSQHGWLHGLSIVAKELFHLQSTGTDPRTLWHGMSAPSGASYTSAIVSAARNSQTISRNLKVLAEENLTSSLIGPTVGFLAMLVGQGWLWGQGRDNSHVRSSTLENIPMDITEIDEDSIDIQQTNQKGNDAVKGSSLSARETSSEECRDGGLSKDAGMSNADQVLFDASTNDINANRNKMDEDIPITVSSSEDLIGDHLEVLSTPRPVKLPVSPSTIVSNSEIVKLKGSCRNYDTALHDSSPPHNATKDENASLEELLDREIDGLHFDITECGALSVSSNDEDEPPSSTSQKPSFMCPIVEIDSSKCSERGDIHEEDEHIWLKVGGGLAVIGAVVMGGVALLSNKNGEDRDRKHKKEPHL